MRLLEHRIPPPVVLLICGAAAWAARGRGPSFHFPGQAAAAALLGFSGLAVAVSGILAFRRAKTTVNPLRPEDASAVVDGGVYAFTRNPMYLGLAMILAGWAVHLGAAVALLAPAVLAAYLTRFQIIPEERVLEAKFGESYRLYRARVRRWL